MRTLPKAIAGVLVPLLALGALSGCSAGADGTILKAVFPKAPSLYEQSNVMVMGLEVGSVQRVRTCPRPEGEEPCIAGTDGKVQVDLLVDPGVPIPEDVRASVVPLNTVGERNVVLFPAYAGSGPKAASGDVISENRTELPVEIDDALQAFTEVSDAVNPNQVKGVVQDSAKDLKGRGKEFNDMIGRAAGMTETLAGQDQEIIEVAKSLRKLAGNLNKRETQLKSAIRSFSSASRILAAERKSLQGFIKGLLKMAKKGNVLVEAYTERLPQGLSTLSEVILTVKANSASVARTVKELGNVNDVVVDSWDRKNHLLRVRANLTPTARYWLKPIFKALGLGDVPCLSKPLENCQEPERKGGDGK